MDDSDNLLARIDEDLSMNDDAMRSVPAEKADSVPEPYPFGGVIDTYSRADAIADGVLVAVDEATAGEAGSRIPVALTSAAWADCVTWTDEDSERQTPQDEAGRLWDVLYMTALACRRGEGNPPHGPALPRPERRPQPHRPPGAAGMRHRPR